jgi:hypothetical protein
MPVGGKVLGWESEGLKKKKLGKRGLTKDSVLFLIADSYSD